MDKQFDTVIKNARVVRPNKTSVDCLDIAIKDGKIARLAPDIQADLAGQVFDAKNRLAFPGCVDAHMHIGIYAPLAQDAAHREQGRGDGRGYLKPELPAHGTLLPQPRRLLPRIHARSVQAVGGTFLG